MRRTGSTARLTAVASALALGAALAVSGAGSSGAVTAAAKGSSAGTPGKAWEKADYTPTRGKWRDYVLAPTSRTVKPTSVEDVLERGGAVSGKADTLLTRDGKSVRLSSEGDRTTSPLVILDFGKEVSGPVAARVLAASSSRPELHVCYSESLEYLARWTGQNNGQTALAPGCDTANIWNGFPGQPYTKDTDSHTLPLADATLPADLEDPELRGGYRYATLFLDGPGWVDVDAVSMRFTAASGQGDDLTDYEGHFLSSDDELNKIWYAGAYTVQINTDKPNTAKSWPYTTGERDHADDDVPGADPDKDVIFDGGKRDRIVWQGDLAVQNPVAYVSTHDLDAVENSLTSLAGQQLEDGYMPAASLVGEHNRNELRTYGEYVTWFVSNMADHYQWTGDGDYLKTWWPAMTKAVAWLEGQRDDSGLIGFAASGSCGHYGYTDCGHETYVNALYARNLDQMASLAEPAGAPDEAAAYEERAAEVRDTVNDALWDDEVGAYRLSTETRGAFPQDGNAMAVLAGVASEEQAGRAMTYLRKNSWNDRGALTVSPSTPNASLPAFHAPLPSWFEVDARLTAPGASALDEESGFTLMKRFWGWMLDQDPGSTFWEHVQANGRPNLEQFSSLAHGWAAGPTVSLSTQVLGVKPTKPGFSEFEVRPHPGSLTWAEGTVPTPHGTIATSWERRGDTFTTQVDVPDDTSADVAVPTFGRDVTVTVDGRKVTAEPDADGYVVVGDLGAGKHAVRAVASGTAQTEATVVVSPSAATVEPGQMQAFDAVVTGTAPKQLAGTLEVDAPDGWKVSAPSRPVSLDSSGRPVEHAYRFFVLVPEGTASGEFPVTARLRYRTADGETSVEDGASVRLKRTVTLSSFDDGTDGWKAGENVTSVARVTGFANGPGKPFAGSGALEATVPGTSGDKPRSVVLAPETAIDLSDASSLSLRFDSYGGLPGATGYQVTVRLTPTSGDALEKAFSVNPDSWNLLEVDLRSWAGKAAVKKVEVVFQPQGSTFVWGHRFQIDEVAWVS
ncbi:alpha-L-rhamnosidase C-terminal domain-containing protein [Mumia sp. DW29H23]|uniref:alpha-L-rhamnosidase C-terminal domain-containing protein n=1 Tax=Mumia sp. DW29H23 TaxID=3421241 RepID=UPI003D694CB0